MAFQDRAEAGRLLAERLNDHAEREDVLVLGMPPGGVPVAFELASALDVDFDVFIVREIPVEGRPDLTLGWVATGGSRYVDARLQDELGMSLEEIASLAAREMLLLDQQMRAYRGDRSPPDVAGRTAILVDDGLEDGERMTIAVHALRSERASRVVVATPVAARDALAQLREFADDVVAVSTPEEFEGTAAYYAEFGEPSEEEIRALLQRPTRVVQPRAPLAIQELTRSASDYDGLVERAREARVVLLGEASHGTHEFYRERAEITKRLIEEAGYTAVAVEADWPDAYRVNRYVRGVSGDASPDEALSDFRRFPTWMWRNTDVADFVGWLRDHNDALPEGERRTGFYGLDLYSLHTSMQAVIDYLEQVDPEGAERARRRYACFDHYGPDPQVYAYEAGIAGAEPCEAAAIEQLLELQHMRFEPGEQGDGVDEDEHFFAEQNARLVANAEEYYRAMFRSGVTSWNLRDMHMAETLDVLVEHLERTHSPVKVVVWAHNSHVGDARATEMGEAGELNVGQIVRERHGRDALIAGFTTYTGTVTAASDWGAPAEQRRVRPGMGGSWEERLHEQGTPAFLLDTAGMKGLRLERAIGVVYRPEIERQSHYFYARISEQFDVVLHFDETTAVEPLEVTTEWEAAELPETYPFGV